LVVLAVGYPVAVYLGLQYLPPRVVGVPLALLFALRLWLSRHQLKDHGDLLFPVSSLALLCALLAVLFDSELSLRLMPVAINAATLILFAYTFWQPPTMIERFARLVEPELDQDGIAYTRVATKAWCVFFAANGLVALYTALFSSMAVWTLYNGLIAYGLLGLMFAGEYAVRQWLRGRKAP
jgi:uncharacterized membrane protein